jgi:transposase
LTKRSVRGRPKWVRQAEIDAGQRAGTSTENPAEIKRLMREVAELRR